VNGLAGELEEGVGREAGAGAVGLPLVAEKALVGVEVGVLSWVLRAGGVGAVLWVGAVGVLGPEAVEDEAEMLGALGLARVGGAELGRPGEVEEVVVEGLLRGGFAGLALRDWGGCLILRGGGLGVRLAHEVREHDGDDGKEEIEIILHGVDCIGWASASGFKEGALV